VRELGHDTHTEARADDVVCVIAPGCEAALRELVQHGTAGSERCDGVHCLSHVCLS
jgi:hypothetical protein